MKIITFAREMHKRQSSKFATEERTEMKFIPKFRILSDLTNLLPHGNTIDLIFSFHLELYFACFHRTSWSSNLVYISSLKYPKF
jgi:hypothetical protein